MSDCGVCERRVAKTAKALACDGCKLWFHMPCASLSDSDYDFMRNRRGLGFRWFCAKCIDGSGGDVGCDSVADGKLSNIVAAMEGINKRLDGLEARAQSDVGSNQESFAAILKKTLTEVKRDDEPNTRVNDHGQIKTVQNDEVLVLKPVCPEEASATSSALTTDGLNDILKSVPVRSCRKTKNGGLVVKFPDCSAKNQAKALVGSSDSYQNVAVSEPRKMLPKMTFQNVPLNLTDAEIISGIREKNPMISNLQDAGHTLTLVFSRVRNERRIAVVKMSPEVRNAIVRNGNQVFLGLGSCPAFDRFWATQCHHCQKFGHGRDHCPSKSAPPSCVFCAGPHTSMTCPDKSALKCINCSSRGGLAGSCRHPASSLDCPIMISERKKVMENTDLGPSKNV